MTQVTVPIVNAPNLYVENLNIARASNTTFTVSAGRARNSTNENDIILDEAVTVNMATTGINALDTGTFAASTMYYIYAVGSSYLPTEYPAGAVASLSSSQPTVPANYDMYRLIGAILSNGSTQLLTGYWYGNSNDRIFWYDVAISELSAGTATSFTAINLATSVPAFATNVIFDIAFTANSATNLAQFRPTGSSASNGIVRYGCGVAAAQVGQIVVPCQLSTAIPSVDYKVSNGSDALTLLTAGYYMYL